MLLLLTLASLQIAPSEAPSQTPAPVAARWQAQLAESDDMAAGRLFAAAISEQNWLEGARLADELDGVQIVPQYQALIYQMVGRTDLVGRLEARGELPAREPCPEAAQQEPALNAILERVPDHRFVILNDSHSHAYSRVLLHQLLEPLAAMGFRYLAVEDFSDTPEAYASMSYPGEAMAWQSSREPVFADAIRHAIALGYQLVPYEVDF